VNRKPGDIILTGLLRYDEYISLIQQVAVVDLTTDDKTMVIEGYEAVALEQPLSR
jgi:hypothetical protein